MLFHPSFNSIKKNIKERIRETPRVVLVLGSGLSEVADNVENPVSVQYEDIPDFLRSKVAGHRGYLVYGKLGGKKILIFAGRAHLYEGAAMYEVTLPAQVASGLGAEAVILTSSAGALNPDYRAGDLVLVHDQINLMGTNPLFEAVFVRKKNPFESGRTPFVDMDAMFDTSFEEALRAYTDSVGVALHRGVAAAVPGPIYETPAERRMIRALGADVVSMSTIPEAIAARYLGLRIAALDLVTNEAHRSGQGLSHEHVLKSAAEGAADFAKAVIRLVELFP